MTIIPANTANKGCLVKLTKMTLDEVLKFIDEDRAKAEARGEPEPWKGAKEFLVREMEAEAKATETPKHTVFLTFPDGSIRSFPGGVTGIDVAESISKTLAKRTVAVSLNGKIIAASDVLESGRIEIICSGDPRANVTEALNAAHKAVCAELRTRLGDGFVVLRELEPNSDVVKFVNALNEGTASTETPAKVFTRKDMKRVNFLTGEGVAEAKEKAISILLDTYRADIALFAKQVFGAKLTPEQIKFCEEFRTERTITRHEPPAWGKTYVAAIAVWWSLVCFDDVRVSIFGPCESAIKVGLWRQVLELHARMAAPFKDLFYVGMVRISRKGKPRGCFAEMRLAGDDIASARGIHAKNNFVFVDEADGVSEEVIANLHGIFNDPNAKLCLLSTDMSKFAKAKPDAAELFDKDRYVIFDIEELKRFRELELPILIEPLETVTEAELFNEALSSLRAMVSGEVRSDPVRLEAIRYQLENADHLSKEAKRAD